MNKTLEQLFNFLYPIFRKWGLGYSFSSYLSLVLNIIILIVLTYTIYMFFRFLFVTAMAVIALKTKTKFDDLIISNKTVIYIAQLIPFGTFYIEKKYLSNE